MKITKIFLVFAIVLSSLSISKAQNLLSFGDFFTQYFETIGSDIPQSYKYIKLNFKNINPNSDTYQALQKGVYMDLLPNKKIDLQLNQKVTQKHVSMLIKNNFGINIDYISGYVSQQWLSEILLDLMDSSYYGINIQDSIMEHVYHTLINEYLYDQELDEEKMTYGAIKGMVKSLNDPYTEFFDPQEAKEFSENINGQFEGIGIYIEKNINGEIIVISPLKGSPAQQAGILPKDIITHINHQEITIKNTITEVSKMIKGPESTTVNIKVKRGDKQLEFVITRKKINIENLEYEILENGLCYMAIHMFSFGINTEFDSNIANFQNCSQYVFDIRNNPGGGLIEVSDILSYFVPTGEPTIHIKDKYSTSQLKSKDKPFKIDKNITILINGGSASASEIFAGTIKDYIPSTLLIGENTFGKGSLQSIIDYVDGSILKYTQAKRYTGKHKKDIDKTGINPDIKMSTNQNIDKNEIIKRLKNLKF